MLRESSHDNTAAVHVPSFRARCLFATAMLVVGLVPMSPIAGAAGQAAGGPTCSGATYSVVSGDSWSLIASRAKVKMAALVSANAATTATVIHPGQTLCLPPAAAAAAATTTSPSAPSAPLALTATVPLIDVFPVQGTCSFNDTYGAPRSGMRVHEGVDIIAKAGQWIYAVKDGTLTKQYLDGPASLSGNGWRLTAADGTYFFYAHLSVFAAGLSVGSKVRAGQIIGQVGMTGNAPIPHLHFEVHPGGGASVNPTPVVRAVDGCKVTVVPPQPNDPAPVTTPPTTEPASVPDPAPAPSAVPAVPQAHRRAVVGLSTGDLRPRRAVPSDGG